MSDASLQQAIQAARSGQHRSARVLLARLIREDANNEPAWLWLAAVVEDEQQQLYCLQQALRINPGNQAVARHVAQLAGRLDAPPPPSAPVPPEAHPGPSVATTEPAPQPAPSAPAPPEAHPGPSAATSDPVRSPSVRPPHCPRCGSPWPGQGRFCIRCGTDVVGEGAGAVTPPTPVRARARPPAAVAAPAGARTAPRKATALLTRCPSGVAWGGGLLLALLLVWLAVWGWLVINDPLVGTWERFGDTAAGAQVRVSKDPFGVNRAQLIKVSGRLAHWEIGQAKWRNLVKVGYNLWQGEDLFERYDSWSWEPAYFSLDGRVLVITHPEMSWFTFGMVQTWVKK